MSTRGATMLVSSPGRVLGTHVFWPRLDVDAGQVEERQTFGRPVAVQVRPRVMRLSFVVKQPWERDAFLAFCRESVKVRVHCMALLGDAACEALVELVEEIRTPAGPPDVGVPVCSACGAVVGGWAVRLLVFGKLT